jgi:hypothetical protein
MWLGWEWVDRKLREGYTFELNGLYAIKAEKRVLRFVKRVLKKGRTCTVGHGGLCTFVPMAKLGFWE